VSASDSLAVIVLSDSSISFQYMADVLAEHIPDLSPEQALNLAYSSFANRGVMVFHGPAEPAQQVAAALQANKLKVKVVPTESADALLKKMAPSELTNLGPWALAFLAIFSLLALYLIFN
jgi:hypothetical protein